MSTPALSAGRAAIEMRTLTAVADLERYLDGFERFLAVRLPLDYVARARVRGCFLDGELVGGFCQAVEPPLRVLQAIPSEVRRSHPVLAGVPSDQLLEVNGLWIASRTAPRAALALMRDIARESVVSGRRYLLLGFDAERPELRRLYASRLTEGCPIFEGPPEPRSGSTLRRWCVQLLDVRELAPRWGLSGLMERNMRQGVARRVGSVSLLGRR